MSEAEGFQPPRAFLEFRIVRPLGSGATGEVFLADDELLGRKVAIKFVRQAGKPQARARFLLEARALARLSHPNVVTVHRVGEVLGRPFLVSEWVQGQSLDKVPLPLSPAQALQVAVQLARALSAVHRMGVLHRDLKPANVLLAETGEVKLVDFGASAGVEDESAPDAPMRAATTLAETQPLPGASEPAAARRASLQVGTPLYAAPELLGGAAGSVASELYGWGALVYEACTGRPPYAATSLDELRGKAESGKFAPLSDAPEPLCALIHRCLSPRPQDRPQRAEVLLETLEPLLLSGAAVPDEPYRGLSVFGPEHATLFFGREREAAAVLERLRGATFVLVAGDSGVGKSSLCRAGVLPRLQDGALERGRRFRVVEASPGTRPVEALAAALSPWLSLDERSAAAALRREPEELAIRVRAAQDGEGRALFIDGLEEVASLSPAEDAECIGRFLGALTVRSAGFRFLATARSDFLTRLAALRSLGPEVGNALYLLRPLTDEGLRQAIEGPARAAGFRFAPETLVDELAAAAKSGPGALPLVQFALAELWRKRDRAAKVITRAALVAIGGVDGALARHADEVVAGLPGPERRAASQILRRLVTAQGARARRTREELPPGSVVSRALVSLTDARLLILRDPVEGSEATYELAHEALLQAWDQLRAWVGQDAEKRALAQRVERAAEEWERLGKADEALWSRRRLRDVEAFAGLPIGDRERRFLSASRAGARRRRLLQLAAAVALPLSVALAVGVARTRAQAARREQAAVHLRDAAAALARARALDGQDAVLAREAFARFDAGDAAQGEASWKRVREVRAQLGDALSAARGSLDGALVLAPGEEARALLAELLVLRLSRAQGDPLSRERDGLLAQLGPLDPQGTLRAPFTQDARLRVAALPPGASASLRSLSGEGSIALSLGEERRVRPGSYVVELSTGARLPIFLRYGDARVVSIAAPSAPLTPGFIQVPAGRFLTGFDGDDDVRLGFFGAPPLHERETGPFAISRTEVTFGQWLDYLRSLPPDERARRLPGDAALASSGSSAALRNGLSLTLRNDGRFVLRMKPTTVIYEAAEGEPLVYPGRKRNASVDWRKLPVSGVSFQDALAYAAWLRKTGAVPNARLCTEDEWERAARGADGRSFPSGDTLAGDEANIDETYGREPLSFGPDPVGSHPRSDSPVGAADMAGNVWELTVSRGGAPAIRGGSFYQGALTARSVNREVYEPTARDLLVGVRLCANAL